MTTELDEACLLLVHKCQHLANNDRQLFLEKTDFEEITEPDAWEAFPDVQQAADSRQQSDYEKSLSKLKLLKLSDRRKFLSLKFAKGCVSHPKMKHLFPINEKPHLNLRNKEKYQVFHANTERYKVSPVLYLQRLLNKNHNGEQGK